MAVLFLVVVVIVVVVVATEMVFIYQEWITLQQRPRVKRSEPSLNR